MGVTVTVGFAVGVTVGVTVEVTVVCGGHCGGHCDVGVTVGSLWGHCGGHCHYFQIGFRSSAAHLRTLGSEKRRVLLDGEEEHGGSVPEVR